MSKRIYEVQGKTAKYERALVLGMGLSGVAAAKLLIEESCAVTIVDSAGGIQEAGELMGKQGAEIITECTALPKNDFDICVVSPGIACDSEWVSELEGRGISVISELQLGASRCQCRMIAVTGTNGKSTMVKFVTDVLELAGKKAALAGNYGIPICSEAGNTADLDWLVIEVSSFQLEKTVCFSPDIAVLMNVQPDHLNRHGSIRKYTELKSRVFGNSSETVCIVHDELRGTITDLLPGKRDIRTFGLSERAAYRYSKGKVYEEYSDSNLEPALYDFCGTGFGNEILGQTAAAAVASARAVGVDPAYVEKSARVFSPLPHRMELAGEISGIRFVNDSKATNLAAMDAALKMTNGQARLIAGGLLKEKNLDLMKEILVKKVSKAYVIGEAAQAMKEAWADCVQLEQCSTLDNAVRLAAKEGQAGETVLLSPGCASFDQFENFEHRGNTFKDIVKLIIKEKP